MMANKRNGTLYTGVTGNLCRRIYEHKNDINPGFTQKYQVHNLVWYDVTDNIEYAIEFEKRLKRWRRSYKLALIEKDNPSWQDLYPDIIEL